jgi:beta-lactamase class A
VNNKKQGKLTRNKRKNQKNNQGQKNINISFFLISFLASLPFIVTGVVITNFNNQNTFKKESQLDQNRAIETVKETDEAVYQYEPYQEFNQSEDLQKIVDKIVTFTKQKGLPTDALSITLIDINSHSIAEYKQEKLRFPASVVKLFWMVNLYAQLEKNKISDSAIINHDLYKMIVESDNEASSRILDILTDTQSGEDLEGEEYQKWLSKRYQVNNFFSNAGYENINISQKTFPIPYIQLYEPKGRDLQMRGDPKQPIRNKISTYQAARLMYEIAEEKAISPVVSQKMKQWLLRDLKPEAWKNIDPNQGYFNPVRAFFGESLPINLSFYSKAGWTSQTRQEVAFIKDDKIAYILAIFAEDKSFSQDEKIFPQLSKLVYQEMTLLYNSKLSIKQEKK